MISPRFAQVVVFFLAFTHVGKFINAQTVDNATNNTNTTSPPNNNTAQDLQTAGIIFWGIVLGVSTGVLLWHLLFPRIRCGWGGADESPPANKRYTIPSSGVLVEKAEEREWNDFCESEFFGDFGLSALSAVVGLVSAAAAGLFEVEDAKLIFFIVVWSLTVVYCIAKWLFWGRVEDLKKSFTEVEHFLPYAWYDVDSNKRLSSREKESWLSKALRCFRIFNRLNFLGIRNPTARYIIGWVAHPFRAVYALFLDSYCKIPLEFLLEQKKKMEDWCLKHRIEFISQCVYLEQLVACADNPQLSQDKSRRAKHLTDVKTALQQLNGALDEETYCMLIAHFIEKNLYEYVTLFLDDNVMTKKVSSLRCGEPLEQFLRAQSVATAGAVSKLEEIKKQEMPNEATNHIVAALVRSNNNSNDTNNNNAETNSSVIVSREPFQDGQQIVVNSLPTPYRGLRYCIRSQEQFVKNVFQVMAYRDDERKVAEKLVDTFIDCGDSLLVDDGSNTAVDSSEKEAIKKSFTKTAMVNWLVALANEPDNLTAGSDGRVDQLEQANTATVVTAHSQQIQQLQQTLRERYKNHPEWFERRGKKSIALSSVYVQLRIQQTKNANENSSNGKNNDQEDANHVGEIVTGDALPRRARAGSNLVLMHGPAGIGKTTLCKQLCVEQKLDGALAIFVPLKKLRECGEINNVGELLSQVANYELTKDDINFICANDVPILWLLDGFDEVQSAPGEGIRKFLHHFVDPITRKTNATKTSFRHLVRPFDSVVVSSREERTPNDNCDLDRGDVDLWVVQAWPKKEIEDFCTKWFTQNGKKASEIPAMVQDVLVASEDTSLMQHFAGLPLIVHMMCELRLDEFHEWTSEKKFFADISPAQVFERMTKFEWRRSIGRLNNRFRDEATPEQKEQFNNGVDDSLYEFMMDGAARQGYKELIEHGGGVTEFSLSLDLNTKKLPLWALLLAESGLLRFSDDLKHGSFPHRTFIEFLAARYVAKFPRETLLLQSDYKKNSIPWENRYRMVWLLLADMALQNQTQSEKEQGAARSSADAVDVLVVSDLVQHVVKRYIEKYESISGWRGRDDAKIVAEYSEIVACNLLLQLCQVLPCDDVLDSIKRKHDEKKALIEGAGKQSFESEFLYDNTLFLETTPPHFGWLLEHTGSYGAANVLNWINDNYKQLVTPVRMQSALARAYSAHERPAVSSFITVLSQSPWNVAVPLEIAVRVGSMIAASKALKAGKFDVDIFPEHVTYSFHRGFFDVAAVLFCSLETIPYSYDESKMTLLHAIGSLMPQQVSIWNEDAKPKPRVEVREWKELWRPKSDVSQCTTFDVPDYRITDQVVRYAAKHCRQLQHLDVSFTQGEITDASISEIAKHCPQLRHLDVSLTEGKITDAPISEIANHCPQLQHLEVRGTEGKITDASISEIAKHCLQLQHLDVKWTKGKITDASISEIAKHCPQLQYLDASETEGEITDTSIFEVAKYCPQLQLLNVSGTKGKITDASISEIAKHCPQLQHLDVACSFGKITDASICEIAKHCPQLQILNVAQTPGTITATSISEIAKHCPQLQHLDVRGTGGKITESSLSVVKQYRPRCKIDK